MKKYRLIFAIIVLLLLSIAMSACGGANIELVLNTDGGSGDGETALLGKDTVLPTPEKLGYSFKGWYIDESFSTPYDYEVLAKDAKFGDKKVIYAEFEPILFNVSYILNGGTNDAGNPAVFTVDDDITLSAPTRTGYTFGGWYDNEVFSGAAITKIAAGSIGDKTFYAKWLPYDITYFLNGGVNNPLNVPTYDGSQVITLHPPTRTGYIFQGWYTNADFSGASVAVLPAGSTRNRDYYAKWQIESFSITYNLAGGANNPDNVSSYNITQSVTLHDAVRNGYNFEGWYLVSTETHLSSIPQGTVDNIELEARWSPTVYTITYILGGGENADNPAEYTILDSFSLKTPTRRGYTFSGWTNAENHSVTAVSAGSTGNKVFYANWQVELYNIYYSLDGGSASNPAVYNITSNITLAPASKYGYTFKGWYTAQDFAPESAVTHIPLPDVLDDITLYARFITRYTITYELSGGSNTSQNPTNFTEEDSVSFLPATRTGYNFGGWYLEESLTTPVTQIEPGRKSDLKIYAKWNPIEYGITYHLNGGTQTDQNVSVFTIEQAITLHAPTRTGYTFGGWFNNEALTGTAVGSIPKGTWGNRQYYAKWTLTPYTITYVLNGGANHPTNRTSYTLNDSFTFGEATKVDNVFDGWYSDAAFQNRVYGIEAGTTGAKTFYAKFITEYKLTYEVYGGQHSNPLGYTGKTEVILTAAAKANNRFMGWYDNASFSGAKITSIPQGAVGNIKLYAKFLAEYSITYNLDSGINNAQNPSKFIVEDVIVFAEPTKNGYLFEGWYSDANHTIAVTGITNGTQNVTVYAKWSIINYTIEYELNGGENNAQNPESYFVNTSVALLPATKNGYVFMGWYDNAAFSGSAITMLGNGGTGDKTLYAKFLIIYGINYILQGGENNSSNPIVYNAESNITLLPATKLGYEFIGWMLDDQPISIISGMTGDITLSATFDAINYNINYVTDGGTTESPSTYTVSGIALLPAEKEHYVFENWYYNAAFDGEPVTEIAEGTTGEVTLYAKYHAHGYDISYTLNGGTNHPDNAPNYTVLDEITLKDPTRNEYVFLGWYDNASFNGTPITTIPVGSFGNKHFYAKWQVKVYSIEYMLFGGTNHASNISSYTTEDTVSLYPATRAEYTFGGWYDFDTRGITAERLTADGIVPVTQIPLGSVGNRVFYARWISEQYTITYELDGGVNNTNNPAIYNRDSQITFLSPSKPDYTFKGWYDNASFSGQPVTGIALGTTGNKTFYARFALTYRINYILDGGTFNSEPATYTVLDTVTLGTPQKASHVFLGWYENALFEGSPVTGIAAGSTGNKEFYAKFLQLYQVVYYLNSGTNHPQNPTSYNVEQSFDILSATRNGYIFVGWFANSEFSGSPITEIPLGSTGSMSLYAKFLYVNDVAYVTNGGTNSPLNPTQYTTEDNIVLEPATRTGYTFMGWYDNANFIGSPITTLSSSTSGMRNLYAKWEIVQYTITYILNGGLNSQNPISYNVATPTITLQNANRTNYLFMGWYDNEELSGSAISAIHVGTTGNKTFYAKWEAIEFTITYNLGGGVNAPSNPTTYTVLSPEITFANPTREGATFKGWYDNASYSGSPVTVIAAGSVGNRTIFAKWEFENYVITYNLYGGTNSQQNPTLYNVGSPATLYAPVKAYNTFLGWYDNAGFTGEKLTEITGRTGAITLHARFATTYYVNYTLNGGTQNSANPANFTEFNPDTALLAPTKTNYDFVGWYASADFSGEVVSQIEQGTVGNINLYAKWTPSVFNITYNLNGGINGANPATFTVETPNITFAPATREGFTFGGWYDNAEYTGISITVLPYGSYGHKTYYAKWTIINYTITYNLNGGNNSPYNPTSYTVQNNDIVLDAPLRNYYSFEGWYTNADFSGAATTVIPSGSVGERTLYAKWEAISYSIVYHIANGTNAAGNPYSYTYDDIITLSDPSRENFIFVAWYTNSAYSGNPISVISQRSGELHLYAKWQAVTYDIIYNLNGGSNPLDNPTEYDVESNIRLLNATRANHNFLGWYLTPDFSGEVVTHILPGSGGTIMLYARFLPSFAINYYLYDGTNSPNNPASYTNIDDITLEAPTKQNYIFIGWYDNANFEGEAAIGIAAGSTGVKNFYAKFLFAYRITYYLNGGQNDSQNPAYYLEDMTIVLNEPYRSGYVFMGWYDNAAFNGEPVTTISGSDKQNKSLYAWWGGWSQYMYYGEYPQTLLENNAAIEALNDGIADSTILADGQGYYAYEGDRYAKYIPTASQNGYNQGETYYFKVEPIKWRILGSEGAQAIVISDVILDSMAFNTVSQNLWASSALREWLNGDFYDNTFVNADNHYHIVETDTVRSHNPAHGSNSGADVEDNLSLLSIEGATNFEYGFNSNLSYADSNRAALNSDYAKARGAYTDGDDKGAWWLYTPGSNSYYASYVGNDGKVYANGTNVTISYLGVRPVMTLRLGAA